MSQLASGVVAAYVGVNGTTPVDVSSGGSSSGSLFDQLINGHPYYTQSEWSNGDGNCDMRPAPGSIGPRFSVPPPGSTPAGSPATFDPTSSTASNAITSATWNFGDGSPPQFLPGAFAFAPPSHTYSAVGQYGVFNGSRFRAEIAPRIADFVLSHDRVATRRRVPVRAEAATEPA